MYTGVGELLLLGFAPTQRGADSGTHAHPNGFFGCRKHSGPGCCAHADPVARSIKISFFVGRCVLHSSLFHRDTFSQITRLIDVSASGDSHMVRQ